MDRRTTPFNGHVAHVSLKGTVEAERFVEGEVQRVVTTNASLWPSMGNGPQERELWFGEQFVVLDRRPIQPGGAQHAFGFCARDGFCGWIHDSALDASVQPTHRVSVARSYAKMTPNLKPTEDIMRLTCGSPVRIVDTQGEWSRFEQDEDLPHWLPSQHITSIDQPETDPVTVARLFLSTPYLWGGNSAFGIDCSGLIQAAFLACGWACPGDSDLQEQMPGQHLADSDPLEPGDLLFWKGHVAMATGPDTMIHANAHHMATVEEPIAPAIARIKATDTGPVTTRLRPDRRPWTSPF